MEPIPDTDLANRMEVHRLIEERMLGKTIVVDLKSLGGKYPGDAPYDPEQVVATLHISDTGRVVVRIDDAGHLDRCEELTGRIPP